MSVFRAEGPNLYQPGLRLRHRHPIPYGGWRPDR